MSKFIKLFFISLIFLVVPFFAKASILYMDPTESQYGPGDTFPIDIKINTEGNCINTVEAKIEFPVNHLQISDFIIGDSVINLWVEKPEVDKISEYNKNGSFYLAGGTPGGYCGKIPGDPGESNVVARIIFKVPSFSVSDEELINAEIKFGTPTSALLNDGFGTADKLDTKNAMVNLLKTPSGSASDWQDQIKNDTTPPEPFFVELQSNPNIYNGQYYIDFFTTDKQSGMDHYEILEKRIDEQIGEKPLRSLSDYFLNYKKEPLDWKKGDIPYLLTDQSLKSIISVKAIDKAGNERQVDFTPPKSEQEKVRKTSFNNYIMLSLLISGSILFIISIFFIILAIKKRKLMRLADGQMNKKDEEEKQS